MTPEAAATTQDIQPIHIVGDDVIGHGATAEQHAAVDAQPSEPAVPPELNILKEAGFPLDRGNLPKVRIEGGKMVFSLQTRDSNLHPTYVTAIAALRSQGCEVTINPAHEESGFTSFTISASIEGSRVPAWLVGRIAASTQNQVRMAQLLSKAPAPFPEESANGC